MDYRQITTGPFCGLFALSLDEYSPWTLQEVTDAVNKAEVDFNITDAKKFFVFRGRHPDGEGAFNIDGTLSASLAQILKGRGYRIILQCSGTIYPTHAKEADFVEAYINADGRWINFPCTAIIWEVGDSKAPVEPRILPNQDSVPKYIRLPSISVGLLPSILRSSRYPWVAQNYLAPRVIAP